MPSKLKTVVSAPQCAGGGQGSGGLTTGEEAGVAIGVVAVVGMVGGMIVYKKRQVGGGLSSSLVANKRGSLF